MTSKRWVAALAGAALAVNSALAFAVVPLGGCNPDAGIVEYDIGFFNGVFNTRQDALLGLASLVKMEPSQYNSVPVVGELFYNHTGCAEKPNLSADPTSVGCLQDLFETFEQRSNAADPSGALARFIPLLWDVISSGSEQSQIVETANTISSVASMISFIGSSFVTDAAADLGYMASNPPTQEDYSTQDYQLAQYIQGGHAILAVAHSQGNLFLQHALADATEEQLSTSLIYPVQIAPANTRHLGSTYALADIDLIIAALQLASGVESFQPNISMASEASVDWSGHRLAETYLNANREARPVIQAMMDSGMAALAAAGADPANLSPFMVSITAKSGSDVFLMVSEPAGALGLPATLSDGAMASSSGSGLTGVGSGLFYGYFGYLDSGAQNYYAACFNQQVAQMGVSSMSFTFGARPQMFTGSDSATVAVVAGGQTVASTSFVDATSPFDMTFTVTVTVDPDTGINSYAISQGASP